MKNEGKKWFKDRFIMGQVHLRPGQPLDSGQFNQDLNWLNNNPFRQVSASFKPGPKLGLTDVELQVDDRFPVRPYVGYENTGTRFTGPDRLLGGFNWGNAFAVMSSIFFWRLASSSMNRCIARRCKSVICISV